MQIFHVISVVIPLVFIVALPRWLAGYSKHEKRYRWLLYLACMLFFISWYLPSPLIDGKDTSFVTHVVGGGMFSGLLWLYIRMAFHLRWHWLFEAMVVFALVSALGAINELAELYMVQTDIASITLDETNWDILANTLGAAGVFMVYKITAYLQR